MRGAFITTVQKRGAAVIAARKLSSAASAANAIVEHTRDWVLGTSMLFLFSFVCLVCCFCRGTYVSAGGNSFPTIPIIVRLYLPFAFHSIQLCL